jgi:hypothetical protein
VTLELLMASEGGEIAFGEAVAGGRAVDASPNLEVAAGTTDRADAACWVRGAGRTGGSNRVGGPDPQATLPSVASAVLLSRSVAEVV